MKTILQGLLEHYKPKEITSHSIKYEIDIFGEIQPIVIRWYVDDPEKHKFKLMEPNRTQDLFTGICLNSNNYHPEYKLCYMIEYNFCSYDVPLSSEELDYINLIVTRLFATYQNEKLLILRSIIETEMKKSENTSTHE